MVGVKSLGEPSEKWFILSRITERINYRKSGCIGGIIISRISLMDPQIRILMKSHKQIYFLLNGLLNSCLFVIVQQ